MRHVPLFVLGGIIIVIVLAIFVFVPESEPVFAVKTEFKTADVVAGSSLDFRTIIINPDNIRTNVTLLHELVLGNSLIGQKRVVVKVSETQEFAQAFPVSSEVKQGKYVLRTTVYFDDVRAEYEANITVLSAETKKFREVEKPVLEELGVVIPEEKPAEEATPITRQPPSPKLPTSSKTQVILVQAESKEDCATAPDVRSRDFCYARFVGDSTVCELIESDDLKSWCDLISELRHK